MKFLRHERPEAEPLAVDPWSGFSVGGSDASNQWIWTSGATPMVIGYRYLIVGGRGIESGQQRLKPR